MDPGIPWHGTNRCAVDCLQISRNLRPSTETNIHTHQNLPSHRDVDLRVMTNCDVQNKSGMMHWRRRPLKKRRLGSRSKNKPRKDKKLQSWLV